MKNFISIFCLLISFTAIGQKVSTLPRAKASDKVGFPVDYNGSGRYLDEDTLRAKIEDKFYPTTVNNIMPSNNAPGLRGYYVRGSQDSLYKIDSKGNSLFLGFNGRQTKTAISYAALSTSAAIGEVLLLPTGEHITKVSTKKWLANRVYGSPTPVLFYLVNGDTISNENAIWKNPNLSSKKTIDFYCDNGVFKPTKKLTLLDFDLDANLGHKDVTQAAKEYYTYLITNKEQEFLLDAGDYILDSLNIDDFAGGLKIKGIKGAFNSVGLRAKIIQKSLNRSAIYCNSINFGIENVAFTTFAGSVYDTLKNKIKAVSHTSNTITLSSNPNAIIFPSVNYPSTDGTNYVDAGIINCHGAFIFSSVTVNGNGTVTLNNVRGVNGSINTDINSVDNFDVEQFISLAHRESILGLNAPIFLGVRENQSFQNLWFNQTYGCFQLDSLGSGGGVNIGVGNMGIWNHIFTDGTKYFIHTKNGGVINGLQLSQCQFYGTTNVFNASINNSIITGNKFIVSRVLGLNTTQYSVSNSVISVNDFGVQDGYTDSMFVAKSFNTVNISGNNFGRGVKPVFVLNDADGFVFRNNEIVSHSEGSNLGFMSVKGTSLINSTFGVNSFLGKFTSSFIKLIFDNTTPTITNTKFYETWVSNIDRSLSDYATTASNVYNALNTESVKPRQRSANIDANSNITLSLKENYIKITGTLTANKTIALNDVGSDETSVFKTEQFYLDYSSANFAGFSVTFQYNSVTKFVINSQGVYHVLFLGNGLGDYKIIKGN